MVALRQKAEQELAGSEAQAPVVQVVDDCAAALQEAMNAIPEEQPSAPAPQGPATPSPTPPAQNNNG